MFLTCFLVIQDFSPDGSNSHLEGGMTYENGRLTVPISGRYYIYAQIVYRNRGRVLIKVGDSPVSMLAPAADTPSGFDGAGTLSAGGLFKLNAGDSILLEVSPTHGDSELWMGSNDPNARFTSYIGAYMI